MNDSVPRSFQVDAVVARRSHRVQFAGGSGHRLVGIVDSPVRADADEEHPSDSPTVLFSHCFTCNKYLKAIVRISRQLAARGATVLRYDMTGLGGSEGDFAATNFESNVADLLAAARYARETLGAPSLLVGHSLGGAASLAAAAQGSAELEGLCGVATLAAPSDTRHLAELLVRMDRRVETEGRGEVTIGGRQWETRPQLIESLRRFDLPGHISRLRVPLLLFHAPGDATVGFEHALRIMGLVAGGVASAAPEPPPVSLLALPGADHLLVTHDADIVFVADAIAVWLQRLLS